MRFPHQHTPMGNVEDARHAIEQRRKAAEQAHIRSLALGAANLATQAGLGAWRGVDRGRALDQRDVGLDQADKRIALTEARDAWDRPLREKSVANEDMRLRAYIANMEDQADYRRRDLELKEAAQAAKIKDPTKEALDEMTKRKVMANVNAGIPDDQASSEGATALRMAIESAGQESLPDFVKTARENPEYLRQVLSEIQSNEGARELLRQYHFEPMPTLTFGDWLSRYLATGGMPGLSGGTTLGEKARDTEALNALLMDPNVAEEKAQKNVNKLSDGVFRPVGVQ